MKEILTIIIPCKNESSYILKTLEGVGRQNGVDGVRVLVMDGGSTDDTVLLVEEYSKVSNLNISVLSGGTVSVGRNNGARAAETEFILFLDADAVMLDGESLKMAVQSAVHHNLITCKIKCTSNDWLGDLMFKIFNLFQKIIPETFSTGTFMLIRKKTFEELGGFDETLHQSEDYFLSRKIPKREFKILNCYVGQDNRRFKKMGYFGMIKMMFNNLLNRGNINHFKKDIGYWN